MALPANGIYVVQGEMAMLVTAMRRSTRWGSHSFPNEEYDMLMKTFQDLKSILNQVDDLRLLDPATYLSPFLEVIRSKETTGPVTSLALSAIHKFLSYGLIDPTHPSVPATVEDLADAVTHARFVGTDHSSDGVVLMKILQVLRTLMLSPEGALLTDESVCEIMLSCFRICFETRLTELLRRNAEQCLRDMTQLIFMRLPQFPPEDATGAPTVTTMGLSLKKRDKTAKKKSLTSINSTNSLDRKSPTTVEAQTPTEKEAKLLQDKNLLNEAEITIEPGEEHLLGDEIKTGSKKHARHSSMDLAANENTTMTQLLEKCVGNTDEENDGQGNDGQGTEEQIHDDKDEGEKVEKEDVPPAEECTGPVEGAEELDEGKLQEYVNHRGIRFTPQEEAANLQPYGLVCVKELFRFLISLCNPLDNQNTSAMVHLGLCLLQTSLEVAADQLAEYPSLLYLIQDPLCRNLLSLLDTERISIFALDLQIFFLLFESMRVHLKYQMEAFFKKLIEIISADTTKSIYELKEIHHIALENLAQMFRIPGLCTELYLNFDCDVYCMNLFEELTKLLSKNAVSSTAYNIHLLSLEVLMTIVEAIEVGTSQARESEKEMEINTTDKDARFGRDGHVSLELGGLDDPPPGSNDVTGGNVTGVTGGSVRRGGGRRAGNIAAVPTEAELDNIKNMKKWIRQGTELFNSKPERAIEYLIEHGVLAAPLDPPQVANFLRENPDLDKKMIGEYICKRSSRGGEDGDEGGGVLGAFADSFQYKGLRIDQALRLYLETFRLPGEAPLIFLVMERFAERWHSTNGEPFANTDAAFRLAYAVIMLNMDQHNHNAKKLNIPMTVEDFVKNLRGCNGNGDFDQPMLEAIFHAIKNEEMVMPAERTGPVRDAYLWRVLQRRAAHATYWTRPTAAVTCRLLAPLLPATTAALSAALERATDATGAEPALAGLQRAAALVAMVTRAPGTITLDTLLLTLAKVSGLLAPNAVYTAIGVSLGQSSKCQASLRRLCSVAALHTDCIRDAWRHILEITSTLYIGRLLPKCLTEVEDYLDPSGKVSLVREPSRGTDAGLLSSLYSYIALGETGIRAPSQHEKSLIDIATQCVAQCNLPALLVEETKFLQIESLQELIRAMITVGKPPDYESLQMNPQLEDVTIFFLELLGQTLIQNRDRLSEIWSPCESHMRSVLQWSATRTAHATRRALTAAMRTCARLMRSDLCCATVLQHLAMLFTLPYRLFAQHRLVIACGVYDIIKTSAQNIHSSAEWELLLALLCAAGTGAWPRNANTAHIQSAASSRSEDSEEDTERRPTSASSEGELMSTSPHTHGWIMVGKPQSDSSPGSWLDMSLRGGGGGAALARCCEALALVIRDVAHVTPHNAGPTVAAVRIIAATLLQIEKPEGRRDSRKSRPRSGRGRNDQSSDEEDTMDQNHLVTIQLLDLMHTLHSRTAQIFKWWRDESDHGQGTEDQDLWEVAWKPLLQAIGQFCADRRNQVANSAISYLQRALLVPGLGLTGTNGAGCWHACFTDVLLPLLPSLPPTCHQRHQRLNTILCKVFLQHLQALSATSLAAPTWGAVLRVQRGLLSAGSEPLAEAALESLKNMILVMHSVRMFNNSNDDGYNDLWYMTWDQISEFLPGLKQELFPDANDNHTQTDTKPATLPSLATIVPSNPNTPTILPVQSNIPSPTIPQPIPNASYTQNQHMPTLGTSPVNVGQAQPTRDPAIVSPIPVSGMVPIRNPLYDQMGLTSSVLLQPLNEMVSTPIGIAIQTQPVLYPQAVEPTIPHIEPSKIEPKPTLIQPTSPRKPVDIIPQDIQQSELYEDYLTNPYNDAKEISPMEATLYDPEENRLVDIVSNLIVPDPESLEHLINPLTNVLDKKSQSENATPMHTRNTERFGSTDNLRTESGVFNFSSYFGSVNEIKGSEFDSLIGRDG